MRRGLVFSQVQTMLLVSARPEDHMVYFGIPDCVFLCWFRLCCSFGPQVFLVPQAFLAPHVFLVAQACLAPQVFLVPTDTLLITNLVLDFADHTHSIGFCSGGRRLFVWLTDLVFLLWFAIPSLVRRHVSNALRNRRGLGFEVRDQNAYCQRISPEGGGTGHRSFPAEFVTGEIQRALCFRQR